MREILHRGKRTDNGEWIEGYYVHLRDSRGRESHRIYTGYAETDCGDFYPDWFEVDPVTVGQYTGLNANGKRIFEGDIVVATDGLIGSPFAGGLKGKVVYEETAFFIEPENVMDTQWLFNECAVYEVIGNIHDNKSLLNNQEAGE